MATDMEGLVQHRVGTPQVAEVSDGLAQQLALLLLKGDVPQRARAVVPTQSQ